MFIYFILSKINTKLLTINDEVNVTVMIWDGYRIILQHRVKLYVCLQKC